MKKYFFLAVPAALLLTQLLFAQVYWNDKTSTAVSVVEHLSPSLIAKQVPCLSEGKLSNKPSWAEEPPLFHGAALILKSLGFTNFYLKLLPWLASILFLFGSLRLLERVYPSTTDQRSLSLTLLTLSPFLYIHATRFLPDILMAALIPWLFLLLFAGRNLSALALATLAITIKATCFFLLPFSLLGSYLYSAKNPLKLVLACAAASLPMIAWLCYLRSTGADNPFFGDSISLSRHTGGADFALLISSQYWGRFFTWVIARGVSLPLFLFFLWGFRNFRQKRAEEKILLLSAAGILPYWILVRGPQFSAPWYSFPFLGPMLVIGCGELLRSKRLYLQWAVVLFLAAYSLPKVPLSWHPERTRTFQISERPVMLSCTRQNL